MPVVKKQRLAFVIATLLALCMCIDTLHAWPSNARNDPYPMYTSVDPHYFLYEREKQLMFGAADEKGSPERIMISFSPFGQHANYAKTIAATYCRPSEIAQNTCAVNCSQVNFPATACANVVEIGDIDGRWNLLGLFAGGLPEGAPTSSLLQGAFNTIYANTGKTLGDITENDIQIQGSDQCNPLFGYVSVPLKYRKKGIRWDIEGQICGDFGIQFQGGIVEISQVLNPCFINLTPTNSDGSPCSGVPASITPQSITCNLFDELIPLARQLGLNLCNFTKWGFEDMFLSLYWRHAHTINFNRDLSWARFLLIPFIRIGGGIATGHPKEQEFAFSLPFGNNGSNSVNLNAGMNFDFAETVEIGAEVGYSHFFKKDFSNFRVPTNALQSGIFPYATNVSVQPGDSAYVAGKLAAYHFLDRLSFYFQYVFVHHRRDHIELLTPDPAFIDMNANNPRAKCPNTVWHVQLGNIAFTYDVSPNVGIGFLWQQMFHVRNAYNSTTAMFTLNLIF